MKIFRFPSFTICLAIGCCLSTIMPAQAYTTNTPVLRPLPGVSTNSAATVVYKTNGLSPGVGLVYDGTNWVVGTSFGGTNTFTVAVSNATMTATLKQSQAVASTNTITITGVINGSGSNTLTLTYTTTGSNYMASVANAIAASLMNARNPLTNGDTRAVAMEGGVQRIGSTFNMNHEGSTYLFINGATNYQKTNTWTGDGGLILVNNNWWQSGAGYFIARGGITNGVTGVFDPVACAFVYVATNRQVMNGYGDSSGRAMMVFNAFPDVGTWLGYARAGYGSPVGNYEMLSLQLDTHETHFGRYVSGAYFPGLPGWLDVMSIQGQNNIIGINGEVHFTNSVVQFHNAPLWANGLTVNSPTDVQLGANGNANLCWVGTLAISGNSPSSPNGASGICFNTQNGGHNLWSDNVSGGVTRAATNMIAWGLGGITNYANAFNRGNMTNGVSTNAITRLVGTNFILSSVDNPGIAVRIYCSSNGTISGQIVSP